MGYTHVHLKKDKGFHCAIGSNCSRIKVIVSKKTVSTSMCPHEHISTVLSGKYDVNRDLQHVQSKTGQKASYKFNESEWMANTSAYIFRHRKLDLSKQSKKKIEREIMKINEEGWPKLFELS